MTEAGRLLRYVTPGAFAEAVFGLWLYLDHWACPSCYSGAPRLDGEVLAAMLVGLTFPLGFLSATVASVIRANAVRSQRLRGLFLDDGAIREATGLGSRSNDARDGPEIDAAVVTLNVQIRGGRVGQELVELRRLDQLLDVMNGQANTTGGLLVTFLAIAVVAVATSLGQPGLDWGRVGALVTGVGVVVGALFLLGWSQARVVAITQRYVIELLRR